MTSAIDTLRAQLADMEDDAARQQAAVEAFSAAREADDEALMVDIARLVVGDDSGNEPYSKGWQMFCLQGLTEYCAERFAQAENDTAREECWYDLVECLWKYKWIVCKLPQDLQLERDDIEEYNRVMTDYYAWVQFSQSAVHKTLMLQSMWRGDVEQAREHFRQWQTLEADESADCEACEQTELVNYHHFTGAYRKAVEYAEPILCGDMHCAEVPHITYYPAIASLIEIGEWTRAAEILPRAIALIEKDINTHIGLLPPLLQLALRLGESGQARQLLDKHYDALARHFSNKPFEYLQYLMVAAAFDDDAKARAHHLAEAFDQRNGNHYYRSQLATLLQRPQVQ
ncbi:MAG: hypothetical protein Q4D61_08550 [Cardiobacteriaceae bacterium]|nr:hypothetical protein [Cardiobacteriaceae bacterium]